jgi:hypothetical protein
MDNKVNSNTAAMKMYVGCTMPGSPPFMPLSAVPQVHSLIQQLSIRSYVPYWKFNYNSTSLLDGIPQLHCLHGTDARLSAVKNAQEHEEKRGQAERLAV